MTRTNKELIERLDTAVAKKAANKAGQFIKNKTIEGAKGLGGYAVGLPKKAFNFAKNKGEQAAFAAGGAAVVDQYNKHKQKKVDSSLGEKLLNSVDKLSKIL